MSWAGSMIDNFIFMEGKYISSLQNAVVKEVVKLQQKVAERKKSGLFVVEGVREVSLAIRAGLRVENLFLCEELYGEDSLYPVELQNPAQVITRVSPAIYQKIAYRGNAEGILAIVQKFNAGLGEVTLSSKPLVLVLESVEKPGNLGAILRTADAAGADAVIICDPQTDIFNPNVIRSSLGCLFSVKIAVCNTAEYFSWAEKHKISTMIASVQGNVPYYQPDMTRGLALVFGTEADGLSRIWYENTHHHLTIPMAGKIDSLNVSASAAIMVFEAVRQRKKH